MSEVEDLEELIEKFPSVKNRGEEALWKHWALEMGYEDTAYEDSNGVVGPKAGFVLDEWEQGYVEAWETQQKKIRELEKYHEREIHDRGMLDYYKGYEAGLKNAKTHLIKMMVEEDKASEG